VKTRTYSTYKDSGVEPIGKVPEHWEVARIARLGTLRKANGGSKEDNVEDGVPCVRYGDLYTTHDHWIRHTTTFIAKEKAADYTPIRYGDVLFAASGETFEEIGKSAVNLLPNSACCGGDVIVLRPSPVADPLFLGYALDSSAAQTQKAQMGKGFTVKHIYAGQLRSLLVALPPSDEQRAIAAVLDRETAKLDMLLAKQARLIELLQEKRQAVISHAVTNGLDRKAPMKESGEEWWGPVPSHWEPVRLKALFRQSKRQGHPDEEILSVYRDFGVIRKDSRTDNFNKTPEDVSTYQLVEPGDLVVNKMKAWQGSLGISALRGITSPDYVVFTPTHNELPDYLHLLFRSGPMVSTYLSISNGIRLAQWRVEPEAFLAQRVFLPPVREQKLIVQGLSARLGQIDALVAKAATSIDLMREHRSALISAAVTGKIDVREN
jgi:type I restriction enzyme S subunit